VSILESRARCAGQITGVLRGRGVQVVGFLSPIDLAGAGGLVAAGRSH
jgi:hypothetical protein